jgi:hypothetical protein
MSTKKLKSHIHCLCQGLFRIHKEALRLIQSPDTIFRLRYGSISARLNYFTYQVKFEKALIIDKNVFAVFREQNKRS